MNKAEMSTAEVALGAQTNVMKAAMEIEGQAVMNISSSAPSASAPQPAQTNLSGTPAKKTQATQGENNILKNVFEPKGLEILEFRYCEALKKEGAISIKIPQPACSVSSPYLTRVSLFLSSPTPSGDLSFCHPPT